MVLSVKSVTQNSHAKGGLAVLGNAWGLLWTVVCSTDNNSINFIKHAASKLNTMASDQSM